jgi:hypothetical protein
MGKSEAVLEKDNAEQAFITREELEQFRLDIQNKFNDFASGQIELSRKQFDAAMEFRKGFDHLSTLITNLSMPKLANPPGDMGSSNHQSSVHAMADGGVYIGTLMTHKYRGVS